MLRQIARLGRALLPATKTEAQLTAAVFLALLPALCLSFGLRHSLYHAARVYLRQIILDPGDAADDRELLTELAAQNARRVREAWEVVANLEREARGGRNGSGWGPVGSGDGVDEMTGQMGSDDVTNSRAIRISIVIISSQRETYFDGKLRYEPMYLLQNIARFTKILQKRSSRGQARYSLSICSATEGNLTSEEKYLSRVTTFFRVPPPLRAGTTFGPYHDILAWPYEKEKRDYVWCLRRGLAEGGDYVMMVEDDAIPRPEALDVVEKVVIRRRARLKGKSQSETWDASNKNEDFSTRRSNEDIRRVLTENALNWKTGTDDKEVNPMFNNLPRTSQNISSNILRMNLGTAFAAVNGESNGNLRQHSVEETLIADDPNADSFAATTSEFNALNLSLMHLAKRADFSDNNAKLTSLKRATVAYGKEKLAEINHLKVILDVRNSTRLQNGHDDEYVKSVLSKDMFYAKLYHPRRLQTYLSAEKERLPQLLGISLLLGTALYACSCLNFHAGISGRNFHAGISAWNFRAGKNPTHETTVQQQRRTRRDVDVARWTRCCFVAGLAALAVGRPHMEAWRRWFAPWFHYAVPDVSCCTQAMLYSAGVAWVLSGYLDSVDCDERFHKDDAIWEFSQKVSGPPEETPAEGADVIDDESGVKSVEGYLMQPNVFEHIGVWSALRKGFVDPHLIAD